MTMGGDSFAVGLGAVAGACVDHRSGQTRMPPQERRHEEVFGLGDSFAVGLGAVAGACVDHRSGQIRMPLQERRHEEIFGLEDCFTRTELGNDIGLMGALLPFVLRVVAGACVGRGSGQPRMPPRERQHEGLGDWGILSQAQEWSDTHAASGETARGDFWFGGFFHTLWSGCTRGLGGDSPQRGRMQSVDWALLRRWTGNTRNFNCAGVSRILEIE